MGHALIAVVAVPAWASAEAVDAAWDERFGPFLEAVETSGACAGVLIGGRLVEAWASRRLDAVKRIRGLLDSGQLELLASGLHSPVSSAIPERDLKAQFAAHLTLLKRILGVRAEGAWIPHGVWDPILPKLLRKIDLKWTTLDRSWLAASGTTAARVLSVEREGRSIDVIPSAPLGSASAGLSIAWLDTAVDAEAASAALATVDRLPSALRSGGRARAYLPAGGPHGLWERTLLEDPGSDALHKRMLEVSRLIRRFERAEGADRYSDHAPDPHLLQQARRYLYRAQAAEAYAPASPGARVSGTFRDRAWRDLLRAENTAREALDAPDTDGRRLDLDCDGHDEARVCTAAWSLTLSPARSGSLTELSHRPSAVNILSGVPRAFHERWGDAPVAPVWELVTTEAVGDASMRAVIVADSALDGTPVRLTKTIQAPAKGALSVRIDVDNRGLEGTRGVLTTELACTLGGPRIDGAEEASLSVEVAGGKVPLDEVIELPSLDAISVIGWRARVELELDPPGRVSLEPLPEGGARICLSWPVELWGRERERRSIRLNVREEPHG